MRIQRVCVLLIRVGSYSVARRGLRGGFWWGIVSSTLVACLASQTSPSATTATNLEPRK